MPFHPKQFTVNECWLAYQATRNPVLVESAPHNVFIVQDAASMFIFGHAIVPADQDSPACADAALLLRQAWETKQQWPKKLVLPEPASEKNGFAAAALLNGIPVERVAAKVLSFYIRDVQSSFAEFANRETSREA